MSHVTNRMGEFEVQKAVAAVGYLVEHATPEMYTVMKMMYIADKMHLERFGRFISGDSYVAMKQGPVPSATYNMIKHVRGEGGLEEFACAKAYLGYKDHCIQLRARPDYDELSASDIECLQEVARAYSTVGKWSVRDMSHDDAWEGAWRRRFFRKAIPMGVEEIARQFEEGSKLVDHLADRFPGEADAPRPDLSRESRGRAA